MSFRLSSFFVLVIVRELFAGLDSAAGANFGTAAAFDAGIGIDVVDFTLGDSFNGANGKAGTASYAAVSNYVSHCS